MRGQPITEPLFIFCRRHACGAKVRVPNRWHQRTRRYCSKRCATIALEPIMRLVRQKGGYASGKLRQRALLARVQGMTPVEAFRVGYLRGLQSKHRQLRRRAA